MHDVLFNAPRPLDEPYRRAKESTIVCTCEWSGNGRRIITTEWVGPRHWPVRISPAFLREVILLPWPMKQLTYDIRTDTYLYLRRDAGVKGLWTRLTRGTLPAIRWVIYSRFWRLVHRLKMRNGHAGVMPTLRELTWPGRGKITGL